MSRQALAFVALSGVGFTLQGLVVRVLASYGYQTSLWLILMRGIVQFIASSWFIYIDEDRLAGKGPLLFGDSPFVTNVLVLRAVLGYAGILGAFRAVEFIPVGDSVVLVKLCPIISSLAGYFILGEPWRLPEFMATLLMLAGGALIVKPTFLFWDDNSIMSVEDDDRVYWGVFYSLFAAFGAGFAYVCVRVLGTSARMPWANVCLAQAMAQVAFSIPLLWVLQQSSADFFHQGWVVAMLLGVACVGTGAQILMTIGMQREKTATATAMMTSEVVVGYVFQVAFTNDAVTLSSLCGASLVLAGMLWIVITRSADPSSGQT